MRVPRSLPCLSGGGLAVRAAILKLLDRSLSLVFEALDCGGGGILTTGGGSESSSRFESSKSDLISIESNFSLNSDKILDADFDSLLSMS